MGRERDEARGVGARPRPHVVLRTGEHGQVQLRRQVSAADRRPHDALPRAVLTVLPTRARVPHDVAGGVQHDRDVPIGVAVDEIGVCVVELGECRGLGVADVGTVVVQGVRHRLMVGRAGVGPAHVGRRKLEFHDADRNPVLLGKPPGFRYSSASICASSRFTNVFGATVR